MEGKLIFISKKHKTVKKRKRILKLYTYFYRIRNFNCKIENRKTHWFLEITTIEGDPVLHHEKFDRLNTVRKYLKKEK